MSGSTVLAHDFVGMCEATAVWMVVWPCFKGTVLLLQQLMQ